MNPRFKDSTYKEWARHPVTLAMQMECREAIQDVIANIVRNCGADSLQDRYNSGVVRGLQFCHDWRPELVPDTEEIEDV